MSNMSNWLKAGLIGAAAVVGLQILSIIPCVGCVTWLLIYVAYGCIGALAVYWMPAPRQPGPAAGQGALAGAIAGAIGGGVALIIGLGLTVLFAPMEFLGYYMGGTGVDPSMVWETIAGVVGTVTCGTGCYALMVGLAAGLGALGGVIFAAIQSE
jgi:hypothetical protein